LEVNMHEGEYTEPSWQDMIEQEEAEDHITPPDWALREAAERIDDFVGWDSEGVEEFRISRYRIIIRRCGRLRDPDNVVEAVVEDVRTHNHAHIDIDKARAAWCAWASLWNRRTDTCKP
jgi:hypothetical protein